MFITKKKLDELLHEVKMETAREWERKFAAREKEMREEKRHCDLLDNIERRFGELQKRIQAIEVHTGIVEEACCRRFEPEIVTTRSCGY